MALHKVKPLTILCFCDQELWQLGEAAEIHRIQCATVLQHAPHAQA